MQRSTDRILTTHVGSLIRPERLLAYSSAMASGVVVDTAAYEQALREEVAHVVRDQAAHGVDVVSDGEFGKASWTGYSLRRLTGFEFRDDPDFLKFLGRERLRFSKYYEESIGGRLRSASRNFLMKQWMCVGPIAYTDEGRAQMRRDVQNLAAATRARQVNEAFLPVVAPCSIAVSYANEYYKSEEEFLFALAEAQNEEYRIIVDSGLLLQVDDAILTNLHDAVVDSGRDYRKWVEMNVAALNHALRGIPEDRVRYHLCWGSWTGPHTSDVPLAEIVDLLLKICAQGYSIEAANPRHEHEWTVWEGKRLPEGKILMPGCISHAITHVEHPELVAQRIVRFAGLVGRENVIASSDCGFAQGAGLERQPVDVVWAKFDALAEGAALATRRLWKR
ncbi:MAG TPA: cobalamin-independent methionine synthase II family protein [Gammaproteobacteria bacterium]|nr:cobalamin-independent methionine synthase II family protein [Gammaproteobacteria bacterium]